MPHSTTPTKICSKCGEEKPFTAEYFPRDKKSLRGLKSYCRACQSEYNRKYYAKNREQEKERMHKNYAENREWYIEYSRRYHAANRQQQIEYMREYRARNQEYFRRYRIENREKETENTRRWRTENPEAARAIGQKRRARIANAQGSYTSADVIEQHKNQKGCCYYCNHKVGEDYHVDHVIPISRGGSNGPENIVIACPNCNQRKSSKMPHEWPEGGRLL